MPTYTYETIPARPDEAPRRFEVRQAMGDAALEHDPDTGVPVRRVISGGAGVLTARRVDGSVPTVAGGHGCGSGTCGCA